MQRRVVVHDFSGHPFQAQLARHLAHRGADTTHLFCPSFLTPKGDVTTAGPNFRSVGVALRSEFAKYSGAKRLVQEIEYGWRLSRQVGALRPDIVISANTPLVAALLFQVAMRVRRIPIVFWQQDVYSVAMAGHLRARAGFVGRAVGAVLVSVERWLLRSSAQVVVISEDFLDTLRAWRVDADRVHVVENWAPLDELPVRPRRNQWSERHRLGADDTVFLYAGTLGLKHEPSVLLALAKAFAEQPGVRVVVASEGVGATWLAEHAEPGDRLELIPFQPYDDLPDMLASADVLVVLLEPDAGAFSVPSKVLTYHCAGRAILGAMPLENLASRNIGATGSGVVVAPGESERFVAAAHELVADPEGMAEMGRLAREYAERTFDIDRIADRFEEIITIAIGEPDVDRSEPRRAPPAGPGVTSPSC